MTQHLIRASVEKMHGYVPGEQPTGPDILKLNTNENPYPPSPMVYEALSRFDPALLTRYPDPVCMALRKRLAEIHACSLEQVFVGNGSDEVLALCLRAFVERDAAVGFFDPSYSLYPVLAEIEDVATRPVPLTQSFEWHMPDDYQVALFFLTHPNAPTGMVYPEAYIRDFCARLSGVVLIDEAYVDFAERDCLDLAFEYENVLVARSLSKSFSLAGIRLGYALGPAPLIAALYKIKDSYNVNRLTQKLALAALNDMEGMRRNIERIKATRNIAVQRLNALGWNVYPSQTNFVWTEPVGIKPRQVFESLRAQHIYIRYFPGPVTGKCLRISMGTEKQMNRLFEALEALTRR
jgi:histidinol-phosphate aminotransferase